MKQLQELTMLERNPRRAAEGRYDGVELCTQELMLNLKTGAGLGSRQKH